MTPSMRETLSRHDARWDDDRERVIDFGDAAGELAGALGACALVDRSHVARLLAAGSDILGLLHRLCTADVATLEPLRGKPAVLTTPKGRIVQRIFVHHLGEDGVLLVGGPGASAELRAHVDRFTLREDTRISDLAETWGHLVLIGPRCREAAAAAGLPDPPPFGSAAARVGDAPVQVLGQDGLSSAGLSVTAASEAAPAVWQALARTVAEVGGRPAGDAAFEAWRVLRGLPENGAELTEEHNPLEAGLWDAVSFSKGCYVGQEVVARLHTYDKVSKDLRGFVFPAGGEAPERGTPILSGAREVGTITTALIPPGRRAPLAMAYIRRPFSDPGTKLSVQATPDPLELAVVGLPFGPTP